MLYGTLTDLAGEQVAEAAAENQQAVADQDDQDWLNGAPACNLGEECESCQ